MERHQQRIHSTPSFSFNIRNEHQISFVQPTPPVIIPLSDHPTVCICPHCQQSIVTRMEKSNGGMVWLLSGVLCVLGFPLGCCLIPFCMDDIKDKTHYCPHCHRIVGRKTKL